jgi:hypothetical protein
VYGKKELEEGNTVCGRDAWGRGAKNRKKSEKGVLERVARGYMWKGCMGKRTTKGNMCGRCVWE